MMNPGIEKYLKNFSLICNHHIINTIKKIKFSKNEKHYFDFFSNDSNYF